LLEVGRYVARLGGIGLIGIGIISSLVPLPGSLDFFTILLAAREREWWLYYALMATAGSATGGYLTYRLGHKGGQEALERKISARKVKKLSATYEKWGYMALFVPALMPPPVPLTPFLLGAGAMKYPLKKFIVTFTAARLLRFTLIAYLGSVYGRRVYALLAQNTRLLIIIGMSLAAAAVLTFVALHLRKRRRQHMAGAEG